jgi:acetyl esterase/lipase
MKLLRAFFLTAALLSAQPPKQTYTYKTVADCKIQADVYRAPGDGVRPVILWIHGGALIMGNRSGINTVQLQKYLDAGYTVVSIDYRLAPETKLKAIVEDLQDSYRWVRDKGPGVFQADPHRIAVIGHSAGGYLTLMAGFCVNPRPQALVAFYGYGDIAGKWYSGPDPFYSRQPPVSKEAAYQAVSNQVIAEDTGRTRGAFYLYCRQNGLWPKEVTGLDPDREPKKAFDPFCPIRNVTKDYPPALLLHGDKDTDVPYEQSVAMTKELERHHILHEFIPMPNRGHGFDREMQAPDVAAAFDQVLAFLKKNLGQ